MGDSIRFETTVADLRRDHILQAARQVFGEKGFRKATIKDIARTAGLADGTIYNYFTNKRDLFVSLVEEIENPVVDDLMAQSDTYTLDGLMRFLIDDGRRFLAENGQLLASIVAEVLLDAKLRAEFYKRIAQPRFDLVEAYLKKIDLYAAMDDTQIILLARTLMGGVVTNLMLDLVALDPRAANLSPDVLNEQLTTWFLKGTQQ